MSVARSYAKALYEAAVDSKLKAADLDAIETELAQVVVAIEGSKEARIVLFGPAFSAKDKQEVVSQLAKKSGFSKLTSQFLQLLAKKQRLSLISQIRDSFSVVRIEMDGGTLGKIVSADPMESGDVDALAQAFTKKTGKKVSFKREVDPTLLAGMKVTVNGVTYDGTLRAQLNKLKDHFVSVGSDLTN